jgi:hypothetical protein
VGDQAHCIICEVQVPNSQSGQAAHIASRAHAIKAIDAAIVKLTGWRCTGAYPPMDRPRIVDSLWTSPSR